MSDPVRDPELDPLLAQLLAGFVDEAEEIAARLTLHLLELERRGGGRAFDDLARGLHTLKGSAATLGLDALSQLAHRMEDALLPLRGRSGPLPGPIADALLRSLDAFLAQLRHLAGRAAEGRDLAAAHELLAQAEQAVASAPVEPVRTDVAWRAHALRPRESPRAEPARPRAEPLAEPRAEPGRVRAQQEITPAPRPLAEPAPLAEAPRAKLSEPPAPGSEPPAPRGFDPEAPRSSEDGWRVGAAQVTGLLQEAERLRELRLRIDERRREVDRALALLNQLGPRPETAEARSQLITSSRALGADSEEAADVLASLEEGLKSITTLPIRTVLEPLRRAVRDLCRAQGKEARLAVVGAEVSLDRRVLEGLRAPLLHLVRNAVDHGLELPAAREAAGKHREGAITVRVEQQGNMLFLEIADDGRGLDVTAIRAAALQRGIATEAELAQLNDAQLQQLIFRPNLTTRTEVTQLSGRGVGLDVARTQLLALRGQIEAQSVPGQGTRFLLTLPADLGSSPVLVLRVGEQQFGLPMAAIESSCAARARDLRAGHGRMQLVHREQLIPLHDLGALLGLRQPATPADGAPLLILLRNGLRIGLAVDEVVGDKELFIRALPPEVRELATWQGAATLARGELVLVLRPDWIGQAIAEGPRAAAAGKRALVVDDSLTARAIHRSALESGGWSVHTAASGEQALEQLRASGAARYDVLVADIGMVPMDGLALTRAIRQSPAGRALPIILVSALDGEADRARGEASGADSFLSKRDCASGRLLHEVTAVLARRKGSA